MISLPFAPLQAVLEFCNVSLGFDDKPALVDISFKLYQGEMILLTGESGSGKSVLLKLAMSLLKPEIPYLTNHVALEKDKAGIVIGEAPLDKLPKTRIMVLESGRIAFTGSLAEFQACDLPSVKRLLTLDQHDHSADPYFANPWDKTRRAQEKLL